jgi:hypothetical protein
MRRTEGQDIEEKISVIEMFIGRVGAHEIQKSLLFRNSYVITENTSLVGHGGWIAIKGLIDCPGFLIFSLKPQRSDLVHLSSFTV